MSTKPHIGACTCPLCLPNKPYGGMIPTDRLQGTSDMRPPLTNDQLDSPLDPGIAAAVLALVAENVETFESCQGGPGHAYPVPTVRFHGDQAEGHRVLGIALRAGLPVRDLRRVWSVLDREPTGPWWELTFSPTTGGFPSWT